MDILFMSFFIAWALSRITHISTRNIMTVVFFALGVLLIKHCKEKLKDADLRQKRAGRILAPIFSILYLCGDFEGICDGLSNKLFCLVILVATGIGLACLFYYLLQCAFFYGSRFFVTQGEDSKINRMSEWGVGVISFLLCMVFWTPYLLKNFPGIMTVDSINQYAQIIGVWEQNNHHPWIHTLIIKLFYNIGLFFTHDATLAITFYTLAQMMFMAFCVSYFCVFLRRRKLSNIVYALVMAFYLLVPYQGIYAISMIKDAPFAGFCLLYSLSIFTLIDVKNNRKITFKEDWKTLLLSLVSGIFFCLFRTNGFYAFIVLIPFILVSFRKSIKLIGALEILILAVVLIVKGPVMTANNISQPDLVENLSMPGQQISRVIMNNRELTKEQSDFLNTIMDTQRMAEGYTPYVSDWFKKLVRAKNQPYLEEHFGEFIKIYVQIGLKYPADYLLAYRDQTIGYWFPCTDQVEIAANEGIDDNEFGIATKAVLHSGVAIKINEIALKLHTMIPGIGILWSIGALFWMIIIFMTLMSLKDKKQYLILYLPALAIFLTLMASTPVAYDFRYAYGYVYCMPLYALLPFMKSNKFI